MLYRTYRPQSFSDVAGQEHVKTTITREIISGKLAHSYLFTGPRGIGKTTTARILARAVNCKQRAKDEAEPCGSCGSCVEIAEGRSLDVIEIDAASHTGVDNVREQIIENARFAPAKEAWKVFIVDEVHMLSTSAFNALLKTLEEPPERVMFILATTELHKLPATVVSRCQRFDFRKIAPADLNARLRRLADAEKVKVDDDVLEAVTRQSEGSLRDAESLLSQLFALGEKRLTLEKASLVMPFFPVEAVNELVTAILDRDAGTALVLVEKAVHGGTEPVRLLSDLTDTVRRLSLSLMRGETVPGFEQAASKLDGAASADLLRRLTQARDEIRRAEFPELPLELLIIEWCGNAEVRRKKEEGRSDDGPAAAPPSAPVRHSREGGNPEKAEKEAEKNTDNLKTPASAGATSPSPSLSDVKAKWNDILRHAQEKNHALPYMLGVAEIISCDEHTLTIGFQYAMYRDRLNESRHRIIMEGAVEAVFGKKMNVKAILVAQKVDGTVEGAPDIQVKNMKNLPEGFADLVREFGGSVG